MEDRSKLSRWSFDQVRAAVDQDGLKGVLMRVSRTADDGLPTFMHLSKARRLRAELDAAIKAAEVEDFGEPPLFTPTIDV